MNKAWFNGYLTEEEMEKEHPLELEEIKKKEQDDSEKFVKVENNIDEKTGIHGAKKIIDSKSK